MAGLEPVFSQHRRRTFASPSTESAFVVQKKDVFECTCNGTDHLFLLNKKSPMKWVMYMRYLHGWEEQRRRAISG